MSFPVQPPTFSSLNCCFTTASYTNTLCPLCNQTMDVLLDDAMQHTTPECSISFHRTCLTRYIQERVSASQPIAFCPFCNVSIGEYVANGGDFIEDLADNFPLKAADYRTQSQMVLLPPVAMNTADGDFYRRDVVVIQIFDYERILSFLQTDCTVKFVPWTSLSDNDAYAGHVLEDLKRFELNNALYIHSENRYVWQLFSVDKANPSVFLGFDYINAGYLEIEQHYHHPVTGEYITRWNLVPLTPGDASWILPKMFKDGWNPATGKYDSLPLAREIFTKFTPLQEFLDGCARQGIKDISDVELERVYPKQIALHYANEQADPTYSGRRTRLHIQLDYPKYVTRGMLKRDGLAAVAIRARAARDGLLKGTVNGEEFTISLLRALGLHENEAATVELIDQAYLDEFYEDYQGLGHQS